jgi:sterol desaturase/sphingolipid hydroxylase (fatty acid hydroxylase superfamily)
MGVGEVVPTVAIYAAFGVSNHSNLGMNLGWAEGLFITPRMHRRHHIPTTSQKNFGTILSVWDRMFGKLVRADTKPDERFGVPGEIDSYPQRFWPAVCQPMLQIREMRQGKVAARDLRAADENAESLANYR